MTYAAIAAGYNKTISLGPTPTFLLMDSFYSATSSNGASWTTNPSNKGSVYVAYGSGTFLSLGNASYYVYRSTDTINWSTGIIPTPTGSNWNNIAYGSGTFVVNARGFSYYGSTTTLYSNDTINFYTASVPYSVYGNIAYGSGKFIMLYDYYQRAADKQYLYSTTNGTSWTTATRVTGDNCKLEGITFGGGKFVAVGNDGGYNGRSQMSTDGINWTQGTLVPWYSVSVVYGNGIFLAYTKYSGSLSAVSTDGINWTTVETVPAGVNLILFGNGVFVAYAQASGFTYTSTDGQNWTYTATVGGYLNAGTFGFIG